MPLEKHSFRHLLPTFLISTGTQVVFKLDKPHYARASILYDPDREARDRRNLMLP